MRPSIIAECDRTWFLSFLFRVLSSSSKRTSRSSTILIHLMLDPSRFHQTCWQGARLKRDHLFNPFYHIFCIDHISLPIHVSHFENNAHLYFHSLFLLSAELSLHEMATALGVPPYVLSSLTLAEFHRVLLCDDFALCLDLLAVLCSVMY